MRLLLIVLGYLLGAMRYGRWMLRRLRKQYPNEEDINRLMAGFSSTMWPVFVWLAPLIDLLLSERVMSFGRAIRHRLGYIVLGRNL